MTYKRDFSERILNLLLYGQANAYAHEGEAVHKIGGPVDWVTHPCGLCCQLVCEALQCDKRE